MTETDEDHFVFDFPRHNVTGITAHTWVTEKQSTFPYLRCVSRQRPYDIASKASLNGRRMVWKCRRCDKFPSSLSGVSTTRLVIAPIFVLPPTICRKLLRFFSSVEFSNHVRQDDEWIFRRKIGIRHKVVWNCIKDFFKWMSVQLHLRRWSSPWIQYCCLPPPLFRM